MSSCFLTNLFFCYIRDTVTEFALGWPSIMALKLGLKGNLEEGQVMVHNAQGGNLQREKILIVALMLRVAPKVAPKLALRVAL